MKILLINDYLTIFGGAEKMLFEQKKILETNGNNVFLVGDQEKKENLLSFFRRYFSFKYLYQAFRIIKQEKISIVHSHSMSRNVSPSPIIASKLLGKKVIMTVHDFHYYCPKTWGILENGEICQKGFNKKCYLLNCKTSKIGYKNIPYHFLKWIKVGLHRIILKKYVDTFICPSKKLQEYMIKTLNLPKEKVIYLPNFIEIDANHKLIFENINDKKFLFVGRISKEKGIEVAIKAFDILINKEGIKDIYFEIIGDGPEKNNLENLVKSLGLEKNIQFLGKIDNTELQKYYENSIGLVIPSVCLENNPLVAIEGMKYGTPIIGSNVGGIPDLVEDNKNGFLFKMGNHIELAEKIKSLYGNKEKSIDMGKYGFEKLKKEFDSQIFYEKLIEIYSI